ncbi:MAG TPA: GNAT family N-acetyltransferase, partial [Verrucomicrobiae bacterium]|nr:GNAT family N-acetyltransferase [Verrucomicrobiae bacterium]
AGYFTLAATGLALDDLPDAVTRKLPRYPTVPATLLGRLAVALTHRGKGFGETLLYDAMYRTLSNEIATFALIVDPKDENASRFYGYYQFLPLRNSSPRMYLPVSEIAALFP